MNEKLIGGLSAVFVLVVGVAYVENRNGILFGTGEMRCQTDDAFRFCVRNDGLLGRYLPKREISEQSEHYDKAHHIDFDEINCPMTE